MIRESELAENLPEVPAIKSHDGQTPVIIPVIHESAYVADLLLLFPR